MELTKALMVVAVVAVVLSAVNLYGIADRSARIHGYAESDTGPVDVIVETSASIEFVAGSDAIDWGTGHVDTSGAATYAVLDTVGPTYVTDWVETVAGSVSGGLVLRNIGNTEVSVELESNRDAATFIGGTHDQLFQWMISENEAGACAGTLGDTSWTDVAVGTPSVICDDLLDIPDGTDELLIDLQVNVPDDAPAEAKSSIITATATAV